MTVAYRIKKGSEVFDLIWWNKYWTYEAFKEIKKTGILSEFDIKVDDIGLYGSRLTIKPDTSAFQKFEEALLKKPNKHGYFEFRSNPKNKEMKSFAKKVSELVQPFKEKENPFVYLDVFGYGNSQDGMVDNEIVIIRCKKEISNNSKYIDQLELISESDFYRIKADMLEKDKTIDN